MVYIGQLRRKSGTQTKHSLAYNTARQECRVKYYPLTYSSIMYVLNSYFRPKNFKQFTKRNLREKKG